VHIICVTPYHFQKLYSSAGRSSIDLIIVHIPDYVCSCLPFYCTLIFDMSYLQSCKENSFECSEVLKEHVKFIGEVVGRKQVATQSILNAVVEIKLETVLAAQSKQGKCIREGSERVDNMNCVLINFDFIAAAYEVNYFSPFYLVPILIIIVVGILLLVYRYRYANSKCNHQSRNDSRNYEEERSNNLQNEDTFRRFANPLKENVIVCHPEVTSSVTVVDLPLK